MELQKTSEKFKELFLLAFTRELIINLAGGEVLELESKLEKEKEYIKESVKEIVKEGMHPRTQEFKPLPKSFQIQALPKRLVIPIPRFPARLEYIQPAPTPGQIDLGKLNPLMQDMTVQVIECHGPGKEVIVRVPTERKTSITLTKEEIDKIVNAFSESAKIPVTEGVFRVAAGKMIFTAIISEVVGTKFIIKKMTLATPVPRMTALQPIRMFGMRR